MDFQQIRQWAMDLGFCDAALCSAEPFETERKRVLSQAELSERRQLRFDPRMDDARTQSLAVFLWPYVQRRQTEGRELFVDSYYAASNAAYHAARKLEEQILSLGHFAKANVSYPAKEAAVRAGLGVIGDHSLLIHPTHGTRVIIILMALDLPCSFATTDVQVKRGECLHCGRCTKSCPVGAIDHNGMSHPEKCLRNYMMEGIVAPTEVRDKMGGRLIGCDICQRVCPMQSGKEMDGTSWALGDYVTDDPSRFSANVKRLAEEIGRNAARPQRVRAQAALLCGNIGNEDDLPVLYKWSESEFDAVREHARWAIDQIKSRAL